MTIHILCVSSCAQAKGLCWYCIVIIPYFQRPRHRDRKRYGSHSIAPGLRRGVSLRGRTAMRAHGMGLPLLLRMAPSQNSPGWGPRPQTLPSAWLLEAHLLGWLGRYPLSHKLRGPALPSASPPCLLRLFLVRSLLRGGRVEAWMLALHQGRDACPLSCSVPFSLCLSSRALPKPFDFCFCSRVACCEVL